MVFSHGWGVWGCFQATSIPDTVKVFQMSESGHVLVVKVIDNVRIPAFSEIEVLAQVKGDGCHCYMLGNKNFYMLENNFKKF